MAWWKGYWESQSLEVNFPDLCKFEEDSAANYVVASIIGPLYLVIDIIPKVII